MLPAGGALPHTQDEALETLERTSGFVSLEEAVESASRAGQAQWMRQFTAFLTDATRAAASVLKPRLCPDPNVDSNSMCGSAPNGSPDGRPSCRHLTTLGRECCSVPVCNLIIPPRDSPSVSADEMISEGAGGAGLDGWSVKEACGRNS